MLKLVFFHRRGAGTQGRATPRISLRLQRRSLPRRSLSVVGAVSAFLLFIVCSSYSQSALWKGKKCAVVLTYDDALNVHLDNAIPALDSLGFKGTFYLSGNFPGFKLRLADWKTAGQNGHELANHTIFHPCVGGQPGREWVRPDFDMSKYGVDRMRAEVTAMNTMLKLMDGRTVRTFAYPCGDREIGGVRYLDGLDNEFISARGVQREMPTADKIDLMNVGAYGINGESGEQMIKLVRDAMDKKVLVVFLFHGVGGEHNINVSLPAHRQLLRFLKQNEKDIWVTTFAEATAVIKESRAVK